MDEERLRILNLIKEGKVSAEEGMKLLDALAASEEAEEHQVPETKAKWLRIRVMNLATNKNKVSVNLPMGLVDWALRAGSKMASIGGVDLNEKGVNLDELRIAINQGLRGKIIDVTDEESQEHVEIIIE